MTSTSTILWGHRQCWGKAKLSRPIRPTASRPSACQAVSHSALPVAGALLQRPSSARPVAPRPRNWRPTACAACLPLAPDYSFCACRRMAATCCLLFREFEPSSSWTQPHLPEAHAVRTAPPSRAPAPVEQGPAPTRGFIPYDPDEEVPVNQLRSHTVQGSLY